MITLRPRPAHTGRARDVGYLGLVALAFTVGLIGSSYLGHPAGTSGRTSPPAAHTPPALAPPGVSAP